MQAAPYDGSDALEDFHAWVENHPRIQDACQSIGGWERWAQIDFAAWLHAQGTETLLEDHCFVNGEARNDLTIWPVGNGGGAGGACLELKVFNNGADNQATYRAKVLGDQLKLENNALVRMNSIMIWKQIHQASPNANARMRALLFRTLSMPDWKRCPSRWRRWIICWCF